MRQRSETKKSCRKKNGTEMAEESWIIFLGCCSGGIAAAATLPRLPTYKQTLNHNRTDAAFSPKQHWTACGETVVKQQQSDDVQTHTVRRKKEEEESR